MTFRSLAAAGLLLLASACTTSSSVAPYAQPALPPVVVSITPDQEPNSDATYPRNTRFIIALDGYPEPNSVAFGPIQLHSGRGNFDIGLTVDLVGRAIIVTPRAPLAPGEQYTLIAGGLQTLDNRVQGGTVDFVLRAGIADGPPRPAPPRPTWNGDPVAGGGVRALLGGCAPFCHSPVGASGRARTPSRALDLTGDPLDPTFGLVGVVSVGLRGTSEPLYRVAPGDPARSVLLRKLIGGDPHADSKDPPYPAMRVDGRRMPIPLDESQPALPPLSDDELRLVSDWIAAGAPID